MAKSQNTHEIRLLETVVEVTAEAEESIIRNQCLPDKVYPNDVCAAPTLASGG